MKCAVDGFECICSGVYGTAVDSLWEAMWAELDSVRLWWNLAWCLFGDFNIIKYLVGRLGCKSFCPAMFKFSKFIKKHLSVNLPLVGGGVIICGFETRNSSMSRIDRVMASAD